ncbi:hypothetical protein GCM10010211_85260 [Streptomyces albospinus]|uniref:Uncharacterized protein n=1 Tax=Streptomyces albospinus TaxID=285515 RepID=A0ABQ2VSV3_9ACTN|nr:hypothetical protein [Streptomyces albospinus]GGV05149.1 hypothetical protein GCM10010211_85260 [Streptomyces albospinus]
MASVAWWTPSSLQWSSFVYELSVTEEQRAKLAAELRKAACK